MKDKQTVWSGVKNPLAQKHLHAVKKGDRIFYYHTGDEKAVVGIAKALGDSYHDPQDTTGKQAVVDVGPVKKLPRPVTLAEIKADASFATFPLVRISRLSVMPVSDAEWERIVKKLGPDLNLAPLLIWYARMSRPSHCQDNIGAAITTPDPMKHSVVNPIRS